MKKKPSVPLSREAEAFLEMLSAERGASRNTAIAYGADLRNLEAFLVRRKQKPLTADAEALRAYLKSLDYVGMTPRTVARRLSVIRQLFRFLLAERLREDDPASTLDSPRLGRPLPKVLSRDEVDRLIEASRRDDDRGRMATLLEILYATGLRVSELVTLPVAAVERDPAALIVRGKGDKERMVPLSEPGPHGDRRLAARSRRPARRGRDVALSLSLAGPHRPPDAPALRAAPEGSRVRRRYRSGARVAACAAACLRQPSAGRRRRPAQRAIDAGPCRYRHHADLYPRAGRKAAGRWYRTSIRWRGADAVPSSESGPVDRIWVPGDT